MSLLIVIHNIWKENKTHHDAINRRKRTLIVSKSMFKEQGNYMGHNPKRVLGTWGSNPR